MEGGRGYGAACKNFQRRGNLGVADEPKKLRAAGICRGALGRVRDRGHGYFAPCADHARRITLRRLDTLHRSDVFTI
jgi:hypothetical protein